MDDMQLLAFRQLDVTLELAERVGLLSLLAKRGSYGASKIENFRKLMDEQAELLDRQERDE